jgi:BirA family biotin operon repressor/biotin-[acetyl-CoA-carboxylase] ligase
LDAYAARLGMFAGDVTWYSEIGSTNDVALRLAERGAADGTVVGADLQTAGRGRQGRAWSSPPGAGLYVSAILRPSAAIAPLLTIAAGVSVAEGIREATGLTTDLKWPNDVYAGGRKVAGILAESGMSDARLNHVVLGFGINVNRANYPPEVAARATSIEHELGRPIDRGLVLASCLSALTVRYRQLQMAPHAVLDAWRSHAVSMLNRRVECTVGLRSVAGVAEDIDERGALVVRVGDEIVRVISGEVVWR